MFSGLSRRRVLLLVVLTCVLLITLDKSGNPVIGRVRSVFARVVQPIDTAVEAVALPIERAWNGIANYDDLERENEALWDQIQHMKGNDVEARSAVLEYRELLKLNQLTSKFQYDTVAAQVVGDSPSNFQNTVEISVGSSQGVGVGMPVTDGAGLIGRITKVFPDRSIVLLLTDPQFSVPAQVLSTPGVDPPTGSTQPTQSTTLSGIPESDLTSSTTSSTSTTTTLPLPPELTPIESSTSSTQVASGSSTSVVVGTTTTIVEVVRETGLLEGQGNDKPMLLRFVDTTSSVTNVKVGAIVDTAGGNSGLAPQGIPIGIITKVQKQLGSSSALVEVTPNASLKRLNFVAVVLFQPNPSAIGK
ncbi:MAG: putative rod shape-determining protein MreC [Actinomycetota bacterium]|jgi:cell shape-determining protein MreC